MQLLGPITIVDNGGAVEHGASNFPLREGKGSVFEGGIRVPAFVAGPCVQKGIFSELMHLSDWFPTVSHLAGADISYLVLDGYNMWKSIR